MTFGLYATSYFNYNKLGYAIYGLPIWRNNHVDKYCNICSFSRNSQTRFKMVCQTEVTVTESKLCNSVSARATGTVIAGATLPVWWPANGLYRSLPLPHFTTRCCQGR